MIDSIDQDRLGPEALLELRQTRLIEGIVDGKTASEAAKLAGFGSGASRTPWKLIPPDELRARFQAIAQRRGLTLDRIGAKIEEHLEARANQTLEGKEVVQSEAPDYKVQQKALDQLTSLMGMQDPSKSAPAGSTVTLSISGPAADRLAALLGGE